MAILAILTNIPKTWLIIAGLSLALGVQSWRLDMAHIEVDKLEVANAQITEANQSNQQTITDLNNLYTALVDQRAAEKQRADEAVAQAEIEAEELRARLENSRTEREIIYAEDPDADQWGRTIVPDSIADSLRD